MPKNHRCFLVSFEKGAPDWDQLELRKIDKLPAGLWRMQNLDKITRSKRTELVAQLAKVLEPAITPAN